MGSGKGTVFEVFLDFKGVEDYKCPERATPKTSPAYPQAPESAVLRSKFNL
jgi:hypothetical protein